ncbi:hypothetical protein NPIL_94721 [Nephila pilipes]|uniref:Uncharacterized protein n=1 Tax=Nephila pilipes TaxID=299642 RepID=A0A8X6QHQ0_NEPPI|nr:hypothetical protein NPIL_94721 [Nephila pilipes]
MDSLTTTDSAQVELPPEKSPIEVILQVMESATTSEGLLHIANCVEANLSDALINPQQNEELSQFVIDLQEILDEVRNRFVRSRETEIAREAHLLRERLNSCGVTAKPDNSFIPMKPKKKKKISEINRQPLSKETSKGGN